MQNLKKAAVVAASFIALTACKPSTPPAADTAADEAAFHAGTVTWAEAYNAGDIDRIVTLYAEDAVLMPPDAPAASGHAAMRDFLAADSAAAKAGGLTMALSENGMGASGNLGWHAGTYVMTDTTGAAVVTGKWVETWRKADGKWLIIRDIWNNDAPPAAPAAPSVAAP